MAILKQMHMKSGGGIDPSRHLRNSLEYILKPQKCEYGKLAGAKNCVAEASLAYNIMMETKKAYGKLHGRQGYHYVLSFEERDVSPEIALEITEKLVDEYLHGQFEVVYAVHTDTKHVHSHIVFNSVGIDGYKYHAPKGEWKNAIMPIVNSLCEQYGLSQINLGKTDLDDEIYEENQESMGEHEEDSLDVQKSIQPSPLKKKPPNPKYGRKGSGYGGSAACMAAMIRRDIDECIGQASSMEEFFRLLEARGYRLRIGGNREPGLQHETMERIRRFSSLGDGYSLDKIEMAILLGEKPVPESGIPADQLPEGFDSFDESSKSVQAQLHREVRYHFIISGEAYSRTTYFPYAKNSIESFYEFRDAYEFVQRNNIRSMEDIESLHEETRAKWKSNRNSLRSIYNKRKNEIMQLVEQYRALSDAVILYQNGDAAFYEDYLEAQKIKDSIRSYGVEMYEATKMYDDLQGIIDDLKEDQESTRETLRQISRLKTILRNPTPEHVASTLERNEAEKRRTSGKTYERRH